MADARARIVRDYNSRHGTGLATVDQVLRCRVTRLVADYNRENGTAFKTVQEAALHVHGGDRRQVMVRIWTYNAEHGTSCSTADDMTRDIMRREALRSLF
jgi:hypothetical protein